jgi:RNA polymerase-binding protein DksA
MPRTQTRKGKPVRKSLPKRAPKARKEASPKKSPAGRKKSPLADTLLTQLKKWLLAKRKILIGDVSQMQDEALMKERQEAGSQDISNFADLGSDNFEQEFTVGLIENEEEELREIEQALTRIQENRYGICEHCNKPVQQSRLLALPHARLCIECKRKEELLGEPL